MKIAIPIQNNDPEMRVDDRFGRTKYFALFDEDTGSFEYTSNDQNLSLPQGAGIQSAKNVVETGAKVLIAKNIGPKAFELLRQAGVEMYRCEHGVSAKEALELYKKGALTKIENANVEGHW